MKRRMWHQISLSCHLDETPRHLADHQRAVSIAPNPQPIDSPFRKQPLPCPASLSSMCAHPIPSPPQAGAISPPLRIHPYFVLVCLLLHIDTRVRTIGSYISTHDRIKSFFLMSLYILHIIHWFSYTCLYFLNLYFSFTLALSQTPVSNTSVSYSISLNLFS